MLIYDHSYEHGVMQEILRVPNSKKLNGKSFFISGGTGLLLSPLVDMIYVLNHKFDAHISLFLGGRSFSRIEKRFPYLKQGKDYFYYKFDASLPDELLCSADFYIHGASISDPSAIAKHPVEVMLANYMGLNSILAHASKLKDSRVLYVSSSEIYGLSAEKGGPFSENDYGFVDILNSRASYPISKRAGETLCIAYQEEYDCDVVIARPGHIYGPTMTESDSHATAQFIRNVKRNVPVVLKSSGLQKRSYVYCLDAAAAILTILLNGQNGSAYNISHREAVVTIQDIAYRIAHAGGVELLQSSATKEEIAGFNLMQDSSLSGEALIELGWVPIFSLEDGIKQTLTHYQEDSII